MATFDVIRQKLESFIKKYYTNELIRGILLFLAIGLLYFLSTLLIEYYLWLNSSGRKVLFWSFIIVETALFIRFIIFPLTKLFKLQKGIDYDEASKIIGTHFPEVNDKLLNVIQLNRSPEKSDLLLASIDQKSSDLQPIPFSKAVNFKENAKYLKYLAIPVSIFLIYSLLGEGSIFSGSYERMVNYDVAYEPPAPFSFVVLNENLQAIENKSFTLKVKAEGKTIPENASISYGNQTYFLQKTGIGEFEYTFQQTAQSIRFRLHSNKVKSKEFQLNVVQTPSLSDFQMELVFPKYTGIPNQNLRSTGNATIPEGTSVQWKLKAKNTKSISLKSDDSSYVFSSKRNDFNLRQQIFSTFDYTISTSNDALKEYENLSYTLDVIKDQYPEIQVESKRDSTDFERVLFLGQVSDDYGLTKLQLVYYSEGKEEAAQIETIEVKNGTFDEFVYEFPGNLKLEEGISYEYYFEIFDNDAFHHHKSTRSGIYSFRKLTQNEIEGEQLEKQAESIRNMTQTLQEIRENKEELEELSRTQKEKTELNYNDKKRLEEFLKRQQKQEEMMKNFSKQMKDDLEKFQEDKKEDSFKEELEKRLEENEKRSKENEKLLKELEELQDKIRQENLIERLDEMSKERKKQERNLEQLVELTKRYYVEKKAEKIADELNKLGEKQEQLSEKDASENTEENQEALNEEFDQLMEELEQLREDNQELKNPMDYLEEDILEEEIRMDQQDATDKLQEGKPQEAGKDQKNAGSKMKQKGQMMKEQMQQGEQETLNEDIEMLRQILSNLIRFSFEQEDLMLEFKELDYGNPMFGRKLVVQNELKSNFQHIDDSIYALSVRQPRIGDQINSILTEIDYNLDQTLQNFSDNRKPQASGNQQHVMKGANDLAVLLDALLSNLNMQMQMMASGSGEGPPMPGSDGGKFQLPDIIQKQQSLIDQLSEGSGEGSQEGEEEGSEGEEEGSEGEGEGFGGENSGQSGEGSDSGEDGNKGENGSENGEGKNSQGEGSYWDQEGMSGEIFEIYKQQQKLRQDLENLLKEKGLDGNAEKLLKEMQEIENRLLHSGMNKETLNRMEILKYELMKLDEAHYQQGEEEQREATTNRKDFVNTNRMNAEDIKRYFQTTEILNRDELPLRGIYKERVREYFKKRDD